MWDQIGQVLYTDPAVSRQIEGTTWLGRGFALVDAGEFPESQQTWMQEHFGPSPQSRYTIPLIGSEAIQLPGMTVAPAVLPQLRLSSITSDRMLYRQGCDVVHLLAVDPFAAGSERDLVVALNELDYAMPTARFDATGMATLRLSDLPAGEYTVGWSDPKRDETVCEFTVAEFRLAPLVGSIVRRNVHGDPPRLSAMLHLETFGVPVGGRVRLQLADRGEPIASTTVEAKAGRAYGTFPLTGEGPHAINVQLVDDASRTATVPIVGSREEDRRPTTFSRLGNVVTGSLLPGPGSREVRGIFLDEQGIESSPVRIERIDTRTIRVKATVALDALSALVFDPYSVQRDGGPADVVTAHRDVAAAGDTLELEHRGPVGYVAVGAFVDGKPWEGWAAVVAPSRLSPQIRLPDELPPGEEVTIDVEAADDAGGVYLVVKDARLPTTDSPASRLAGTIKGDVEHRLGDLEPQPPKPVSTARDTMSILLFEGVVSREQVAEALRIAETDNSRPTEVLVRLGYATEEQVLKAVSARLQCELIDFDKIEIDKSAAELIPFMVAMENTVLPIAEKDDGALLVAMSDPEDLDTIDKLRFILNRKIEVAVAPRRAIADAIDAMYYGMAAGTASWLMMDSGEMFGDFCETEAMDQFIDLTCVESVSAAPGPVALESLMAEAPLVDSEAPTAKPRPADEAAVLFAGRIEAREGRASATIRLGRGMAEYVAEAFVVSKPTAGLDWAATETRFQANKDPYAELQLPQFVSRGDGAEGRLHAGAASGRFRAKVSCDGEVVPLRLDGKLVAPHDVIEAERAALIFLAFEGEYHATVEDVASGECDRVTGNVGAPGKLRHLSRPLRFLDPGDKLARDDRPGIRSLRILPGLDRPFHALVDATGDYEHCCCEQTAAKILAAVAMYATAGDDAGRKQRAEDIILSGIRREERMWLPGRGFKMYPDSGTRPDTYWGAMAAEYLHYTELLRDGNHGDLGVSLRMALDDALNMAHDVTRAYELTWPPRKMLSSSDAYAAVRFGTTGAERAAGLEWVRQHAPQPDEAVGGNGDGLTGNVGRRTSLSYAAAALLRGGNAGDLPVAVRLANRVVQDLGPENRLYSTADSVAAIALMTELRAARVFGSGGDIAVNGNTLPLTEAIAVEEGIQVVEALGDRVAVEVTELVEEDWETYSTGVALKISLKQNKRHTTKFCLADDLELVVKLRNGYHAGDLLWVCLPDSLSRVYGGGQIKQFCVDFEGRDTVRVPLVTTGPTMNDQGQPAPHRFAVCLRNMFEEERIGNPGLLEVTVAAGQ